jgi:hypothetical protein
MPWSRGLTDAVGIILVGGGVSVTALLTTVIGLIGVYIAFALAASWVNEQIATYLQLRSKTLIAGIRAMIGDAATADFFGHPLIASLGETPGHDFWAWLRTVLGLKYVTQVLPKQTSSIPQPSVTAGNAAQGAGSKNPPYVSSDHFAAVIIDLLQGKAPGGTSLATFGAAETAVVAGLNTLADPAGPYRPLYDSLMPIWRDARGDYNQFTEAIGSWYDSHMDRVSGWYKRSAQIMLAYIGLIIAIAFNVDTVQIVKELQRNTALAGALASATQAYYQRYQPTPSTTGSSAPAGTAPTMSTMPSMTVPCASPSACTCDSGFVVDNTVKPPVCRIGDATLAELPIGWNGQRWRDFVRYLDPNPQAEFHEKIFESDLWLKLFGLGMTTIAILLGAPFWFDLLGTIVNVRSAGAKPPAGNGS